MSKGMLTTVLLAGMGAVLVTMIIGMITMFRGKNKFKSNRMMQIRVGLQLIVLALFAYLLWSQNG